MVLGNNRKRRSQKSLFNDAIADDLYKQAGDTAKVQDTFPQGRKVMSAGEQQTLCRDLRKGVKVIYPRDDSGIEEVTTTDEIRKQGTLSKDSST